jgi:hypothetical protein
MLNDATLPWAAKEKKKYSATTAITASVDQRNQNQTSRPHSSHRCATILAADNHIVGRSYSEAQRFTPINTWLLLAKLMA